MIGVLRPVLTASRPSQTMAQMGPLSMSVRVDAAVSLALFSKRRTHSGALGCHTGNEALVEGFVGQVFVVLLEVLF